MSLSVRRGSERISVWRRGRWQSMPHLTGDMDTRGGVTTACGRRAILGVSGVDAMVITAIPADLFVVRGCGVCARALLADLRAETAARIGDAEAKLNRILAQETWTFSATDELAARRNRRVC